MSNLMCQLVMSEIAARRSGWAAAFAIHAICTALVLKSLPDFGLTATIGLVSATALAWVIIGSQVPTLACPKPAAK